MIRNSFLSIQLKTIKQQKIQQTHQQYTGLVVYWFYITLHQIQLIRKSQISLKNWHNRNEVTQGRLIPCYAYGIATDPWVLKLLGPAPDRVAASQRSPVSCQGLALYHITKTFCLAELRGLGMATEARVPMILLRIQIMGL